MGGFFSEICPEQSRSRDGEEIKNEEAARRREEDEAEVSVGVLRVGLLDRTCEDREAEGTCTAVLRVYE